MILLEAAGSLLGGLPKRLGVYALDRLRRMGVDVRLNAVVNRIEADAVHLKDATVIPAETVVWTAGVRGERSAAAWGLPVDRSGRVLIEPTLQLASHPEAYALGELGVFRAGGPSAARWWPPSRRSRPGAPRTISVGKLQDNLLCPSDSEIQE